MASTFIGLSIAGRGLNASQVALAATTNNISNVNTAGYSRQVVSQTAVGPAAVYSRSLVGSGVEVTAVDRVRSFRLDQKYWQENSAYAAWETKSDYLEEMEKIILPATDDTSFTATLDEFLAALETMSSSPSDAAATAAVEAAQAVCEYLNSMSADLADLRADVNNEVKTAVEEINSYAKQIAALNQQITAAQAAGAAANELADQRDLLIDKLSVLTEITVTSDYTITIEGSILVSGDTYNELECYTVTDSSSDQYGMYGIRWAKTGVELDAGDSGSLAALLDLRDGSGENGEYKGIPYYTSQLDEFARTFASVFNEGMTAADGTTYSGHADGVAYGDGETTGIRFFSYDGLSTSALLASGTTTDEIYANITAANISLSADILNDNTLIATASADGETGNTANLDDLIALCGEDSNMFAGTSPNDAYAAIVATLATASSYASRQYEIKDATVAYIDNSRSSVSGVSTDEETANMVKYQTTYDANAAMVTTWNEIYETTIDMVSD